jgi:hypothetical protein
MYYLPQPPWVLLGVGFFIGVTCGLAFEAALKERVNYWNKLTQKGVKADLSEIAILKLPFMGICLGICLFLASGLEIFLYSRVISYAFSLPLTIFIGALIWLQLQKLILQLIEGGSQAIDLDAYY